MVPMISSGCGYVCGKLRAGELLAFLDAFNILRAEDAESGVHGGFGVQGLSCPEQIDLPWVCFGPCLKMGGVLRLKQRARSSGCHAMCMLVPEVGSMINHS